MPSTNYFLDSRSRSWFKDAFASSDYEPTSLIIYDGDAPGDRYVLLGCRDGYVRKFSESVATDDGTDFTSYVTLGPIVSGGSPRGRTMVTQVAGRLDANSSSVFWELLLGSTAEAALNNADAIFSGDGTIVANSRFTIALPRVSDYWVYIKVGETSVTSTWALEALDVTCTIIPTDRGRII